VKNPKDFRKPETPLTCNWLLE